MQFLSRTYSTELAGYLGYCSPPILAYLLPLLVISPFLLVLLALWQRENVAHIESGSRRLTLHLAWTTIGWAVLNAVGLALVALLSIGRGYGASAVAGWAARIWLSAVISGLPAIGVATAVTTAIASRWLAVMVGLALSIGIGFAGAVARVSHLKWLPAAFDVELFSGQSQQWLRGVLGSTIWLTAGALAAAATIGWAQRRRGCRPRESGG